MVDNDLKPCYVFDGKPPALKSNVVSYSLTFYFTYGFVDLCFQLGVMITL